MQHRHHRLQATALACSSLALINLAGCGGGSGGSSTATQPPGTTTDLATTVIDGAIGNALVCLDANANGICDPGETQGRTDATGKVTLAVPNADVGKYTLVAMVGTDAVDADHGPVTAAFTLAAPADQTAVISPLTTLVQQMAARSGVRSTEAANTIAATAGLSASPLADYTQAPSPADGSTDPAALARLLVLTAQKQAAAVSAALGTKAVDGTTIAQADLDRAVAQQLLAMLPELATAVADPAVAAASPAAREAALGDAATTLVAGSGLDGASAAILVAAAKPAAADVSTATPGAFIQFAEMNYVDAANYYLRLFSGSAAQNTPDASGVSRFIDRRMRASAGHLATWGLGGDPRRNADLAWTGSDWTACAPNFENQSSARDASGNSRYDYCGGLQTGITSRTSVDVSGQTLASVYASATAAGYKNLVIADPSALGDAVFPSGSKVYFQSSTVLTRAYAYLPAGANNPAGFSNVVSQYSAAVSAGGDASAQPAGAQCNSSETAGRGSPTKTLEAMMAAASGTPCNYGPGSFSYGGVTYSSGTPQAWWGNSTLSLGKVGNVTLNSGSTAPGYYSGNTLLRVAFQGSGSNRVTYYACQEQFINGSTRNCTVAGSGSYKIETLGDARVLSFSNAPAAAAPLNYDTVFVERGGNVYYGYRSKPSTAPSVRFNDTGTKALLAQLGLPAVDPDVPLALSAGSYQGIWDLRDAAETRTDSGTTVFLQADGSSRCQERPSGTSYACTLTIDDPATGAFTLTDSVSSASGHFDFMAGTAAGTYHDPTSTPVDGSFVGYRR